MKTKFIALVCTAVLTAATLTVAAAETKTTTPAAVNPAIKDLQALTAKVRAKMKDGKPTETDLADELKEFETLVAKYKANQPDEAAQILMMQASLYSQVLQNETKGKELMEQLKKEFPDSKSVAMLKRQEAAEQTRAGLKVGAAFPDFDEKDTDGKPLSIANYKGKVVLIDFWATWCGPCVKELPSVLAAYEKHHAAGFEIIGISLDSDAQKLEKFVKEKNMTWPQFFDGKGWENKLAQKYGVNSIPATYLLDREGKIIASNLRGEKLETAVAEALAKN